MRKGFFIHLLTVIIFTIILGAICVGAYYFISNKIIDNQTAANLSSIETSLSATVSSKIVSTSKEIDKIVEVAKTYEVGDTEQEKAEAKYNYFKTYTSYFQELIGPSAGVGMYYAIEGTYFFVIDDVPYVNKNMILQPKEDKEFIILNFADQGKTYEDKENKFATADDHSEYCIYIKDDLIVYIKVEDFLKAIFDADTADAVDFFLISPSGTISYAKNTKGTMQFFDLLRNYGNQEFDINGLKQSFNEGVSYFHVFKFKGIQAFILASKLETSISCDLVIVKVVSFDTASKPVHQALLPLIGVFVVTLLIVIVTQFITYYILNKQNSQMAILSSNASNKEFYKCRINSKGEITKVNAAMSKLFVDDFKFERINDLTFVEPHDEVRHMIASQGNFTLKVDASICKDGYDRYITFFAFKLFGINFLVGEETTPNFMEKETFRKQAFFDSLTDLPTELIYLSDLNQYIKMIEDKTLTDKVVTVLCRIQKASSYKTLYGDLVFNQIILTVSKVLKQGINDERMKFYYIDEATFGFIGLFQEGYSEGDSFVQELNNHFKTPLDVEGSYYNIDLTFAVYHLDFENFVVRNYDTILKYQKVMLDLAEQQNYDVLFYDKNIERNLVGEDQLIQDLVLACNNQEFIMFMQPQYDIYNNKIIAFEMLIRWNNPKYRNKSPQHFIEVAERNGLITLIGDFIVDESMRIASLLKKFNIEISINVSPVQLLQSGFTDMIIKAAEKYGVKKELISLELTETFLMANFNLVITKLNILRREGFKIHLDDFGSGYSSFLYLRDLPIDVIKIDKGFVDNIESDEYSRTIVAKFLDIARSLSLKTVIEGVETKNQVEILRENGGRVIQGYFISRPVPYDEAINILAKYNKVNIDDLKEKPQVDNKEE